MVNDGSTTKNSPLFKTISNVFNKHIKKKEWNDVRVKKEWISFRDKALVLFGKQKMICNITTGNMDLEAGPTQPSLDAKVASIGHEVFENLQFVCWFVNHNQRHESENSTYLSKKEYRTY